ncbi:MAG: hypothetical protein AAFW69_06785 [Pseudomonadota bacterium]
MLRHLPALSLAVCFAVPAAAQEGPESFLAELTALAEEAGGTLTHGDVAEAGDGIRVSDLVWSFEVEAVPGGSQSFTMRQDAMTILPGEGDVAWVVTVDDALSFAAAGTFEAQGEAISSTMEGEVTAPGNRMEVSGEPGARTFQTSAPEMTAVFAYAVGPMMEVTADIAMSDVLVTQSFAGDGTNANQDFTIGAMAYEVSAMADAPFAMTGQLTGLRYIAEGPFRMFDMAALAEMTEALSYTGTLASSATTIEAGEPEAATTVAITTGAGTFSGALGSGAVETGSEFQSVEIDVAGVTLPVPMVEVVLSRMGLGYRMPIGVTDTAEEASMRLDLADFTLNKEVWALFDPSGGLPRDPATLLVDVEGAVQVLVDFMGGAQPQPGQMPFAAESVTLNTLLLEAVGARIAASGTAQIDNSAGIPMPIGGVDVELDGALGLLDQLSAIGLLPPAQAPAIKGMIAAFAAPGATPDSFTSRVEFLPGGSITANGVPLR